MTKAFDSALRLLTRREYSAMELCDKLKQKGFSTNDVQNALYECQRLGYQSDVRFVENYIRVRIHQGYGPLKIRQELKNKGIDPDLIQSVLHQEKDNWVNYALRAWEKNLRDRMISLIVKYKNSNGFCCIEGLIGMLFQRYLKRLNLLT